MSKQYKNRSNTTTRSKKARKRAKLLATRHQKFLDAYIVWMSNPVRISDSSVKQWKSIIDAVEDDDREVFAHVDKPIYTVVTK